MTPTIEQLEKALELCENGYDEPYPTIRYVLQKELKTRKASGRKLKLVGDARERNAQSVKKYRDRKKFERDLERDRMNKKLERSQRKRD